MSAQELTTTDNQLSILTTRLSDLTEMLRPASADAVASAVLKMARSGLAYPAGIDARRAGDIYAFACRNIAVEAIKRGVVKVISGEIDGISRSFIPTPAELAHICRREHAAMSSDMADVRLRIDSIRKPDAREPITDASRARTRQLVEQVHAMAQAVREEYRSPLYKRSDEELNRIFGNKLPPGEKPPASGKWSDEEWWKQQEEKENGEKAIGHEGSDHVDEADQPDGRGDGDSGNGSVFGFDE